ncbi:MAG: 4-hydroxy-tetrahydrodipicolinate synthase [Chloroflexi bacterium]|nr:MAG: 4-hydroxy-tetrahydrodipicolinate synthase [Chloroflexota bacterium]
MNEIGRVITAMITPFNENGRVDYEEAAVLADALINSGNDGLVITGTTGESPTLTETERLKLYSTVKESVGDRASIIAGTGTNNTAESIENSMAAEKAGADAVLLVAPSYNKPPQRGLYLHFKSIAEHVSVPCILYNVPGRTAVNIDAETTIELSSVSNIIGVKEASSNMEQISHVIKHTSSDFKVWSGNDDETFQIISLGGYGVVSVSGHLIANQIKKMITLILKGELESASDINKALLDINKILFIVSNPIPVKYAVKQLGYKVGEPRLPLIKLDDASVSKVDKVLSNLDVDLASRFK